jgi:hypothetical protein
MDKTFITDRVSALYQREVKADSLRTKPTRAAALRLARRLGCEGAHEMPDGSWHACATHEELAAIIKRGGKN